MNQLLLSVLLSLVVATPSVAGSLQICWDATSISVDVTALQALADDVVIYPDLLVGSVADPAPSVKRCNTKLFPTTLVRGANAAITLKAANTLGEVGPASNAITFRAPLVPVAVTGLVVKGLATP